MIKIIAYHVREEEFPIVKKWAKNNKIEVKVVKEQLTSKNIHLAKDFDGLTTSQNQKVTEDIYRKLKDYGIKQIAQRSTGFDSYDLEEANKYGIIISNVPVYSPESIAEFTLTQALMLIRKMRTIAEKTAERDFRWQPVIQAEVLRELTVGIIGTGDIGQKTAQLFKAFGARVIAYDIYPNPQAKKYLDYQGSVKELVQQSDLVSLHLPATEENYHQFNRNLFKEFKSTAYFINNARGSIVHTEDLIKALDKGWLAGAALDTYEAEGEYIPKDNRSNGIQDPLFKKLLTHPKIIFSPHIAHYTNVSIRNILTISLDSTLEVIQTGDTINRVN